MRVEVNGETRDTRAATLAAALAELGLGDAIVATALNGDFVPQRRRGETPLQEGDRIEVVAPSKGG